jgi:hypothetical protein
LTINPIHKWRINAYFDLFEHPWPRFGVDAPSKGREWLARVTYTERKKLEVYVQVKNEVKEENSDSELLKTNYLQDRQKLTGRIHFSYKISPSLEWRTRIDAGFTEFSGVKQTGTSSFFDLIFKRMNSPLTLSTRFAVFDTDDYAIRFYAYENDLLNSFSIPAYYGKGTRFYLNLRYRVSRSLTAEARYSRTYYASSDTIGSSYDQINGPVKSEIKFQVRYGF